MDSRSRSSTTGVYQPGHTARSSSVVGLRILRQLWDNWGGIAALTTDSTALCVRHCVPSSPFATVVSLPRVDGLHHRYEWRDAA